MQTGADVHQREINVSLKEKLEYFTVRARLANDVEWTKLRTEIENIAEVLLNLKHYDDSRDKSQPTMWKKNQFEPSVPRS